LTISTSQMAGTKAQLRTTWSSAASVSGDTSSSMHHAAVIDASTTMRPFVALPAAGRRDVTDGPAR
jgi:hypothetical protein